MAIIIVVMKGMCNVLVTITGRVKELRESLRTGVAKSARC